MLEPLIDILRVDMYIWLGCLPMTIPLTLFAVSAHQKVEV